MDYGTEISTVALGTRSIPFVAQRHVGARYIHETSMTWTERNNNRCNLKKKKICQTKDEYSQSSQHHTENKYFTTRVLGRPGRVTIH